MLKPVRVDVWSDFVCPFCFLVSFNLNKLQQEYGVEFHWHAYELRPAGSPPISPEYLARIEQGSIYFKNRVKEEQGLEINSGPFGINSRPALILEKYAQANGKGHAYHNAAQDAYWLEARDISQPDVLMDILNAIGLPTPDLDTVLAEPEYEAAVDADIAQAARFGIQAVPSMIFENRYLLSGAQPYDVFQQVMTAIEQEQAGAK